MSNWLIDANCDWLQLRTPSGFNWLTFQIVTLEFEWERYLGSVEVVAGLLGFSIRIAYVYDRETPFRKELVEMRDDWIDSVRVSVARDEYVALKADADKWRAAPVESL